MPRGQKMITMDVYEASNIGFITVRGLNEGTTIVDVVVIVGDIESTYQETGAC